MKIAVLGGTGLIGSQVVTILRARGHEAVPLSPSNGVGAPLRGIRNYAGPEVFPLDELGRLALAAAGEPRTVVVDPTAGMFGAVKGDVLTAPADAVIARTTFRDWLAR